MKLTGKRVFCLALVLVICSGFLTALASTVDVVTVLHARQAGSTNQVNLSFKTQASGGAPVSKPGAVSFQANGKPVPGQPYSGKEGVGHILVVDTSRYYTTAVNNAVMVSLATALLEGVPSGDKVMVITVNSAGPRASSWQTRDKAMAQVRGLKQGNETQVDLFLAIDQAVEIAYSGGSSAPAFVSSILVVTDGMVTQGNQANIISKMLQPNRGLAWVFAWPNRESYLNGNFTYTKDVKLGSSLLQSFADQLGGQVISIKQTGPQNRPVLDSTQALTTAVSRQLSGIHYYTLDLSSLVGAVKYKRDDSLNLEVTAGNDTGSEQGVPFNSTGVATPSPKPATKNPKTATPSPSPSKEPTPTPAPFDLTLGMKDSDTGTNYIERLQFALNHSNYFEVLGQSYERGVLGQSTMDAVILFHQQNGGTNRLGNSGVAVEYWEKIISFSGTAFTPSPAPTLGFDTLYLGANDSAFGDGRIQRLQKKLQDLNFFTGEEGYTPGTLDTATLNAIALFCEANGQNNAAINGIDGTLFNYILSGEWTPFEATPTPQPPSFFENARARLTGKITVGNFEIPLWVIVLVAAVLVFAIIIVLVLLRSGRGNAKFTPTKDPKFEAVSAKDPREGETEAEAVTQPEFGGAGDPGATQPGTDGLPVTIRIEYAGQNRTETALVEDSLTIGRHECDILLDKADNRISRKHAQLFVRDGQLYIRDMGTLNGTFVDGVRLQADKAPSSSDVTLPMDLYSAQPADYPLHSGAQVRISHHTLTITY